MLARTLLTRAEKYAVQRPSMVRRKLRSLELTAGAPRRKPGPNADPVWNTSTDEAEKCFARQAEQAYRRLVATRHRSAHHQGLCGQAARQATSS